MGSNAIASGSAILTANADGLASGLDKAAKDVKTWGQKVAGTLTNTFNSKGGTLGAFQNIGGAITDKLAGLASAAKGALAGAGAGIGMAIGGPIGGAIGSAVGNAVGGIGETVVGALASPFERLEKFYDIGKTSQGLGISASQFQGLAVVMGKAGIAGENVGQVFAQMGKNISDVSEGKGKGAMLAFQQLGIDTEQLAQMKPDKQFMAIADAFKAMGPGAAASSAAVHLFGGNAAGLLPELMKGSAGIQSFIDVMKKTGAVLSDDQLAAAANAAKAWKDAKNAIKGAWDGLANRATLLAAPVIAFVGKAVSKVYTFLIPVFEWVGRAIAQVADITTAVFEQLTKWFEIGVRWVQEFGTELFSFTGEWPTIESVIVDVFRNIGVVAAYAWDVVKAGAGAFAYVSSFAVDGLAAVAKQFKDLIQELAAFGYAMSKANGKEGAADFFKAIYLDAESVSRKLAETAQGMRNFGKGTFNGFGKSAEDFNKWLDEALKKKGKIEEPAGGGGGFGDLSGPPKLTAALAKGSTEAYSLVLKNQLAGAFGQGDVPKQQLKAQKDGNKLQGKAVDKLGAIDNKLANIGVT